MSLIKKNQLSYGEGVGRKPIIKPISQKFQLNVSLPKEKIEEEIALLKSEIMKEAEEYRIQLEHEKAQLHEREKVLAEKIAFIDQDKQSLFSDVDALKEKAKADGYDVGYKEGIAQGKVDGLKQGDAEGRADYDKARKDYENELYKLLEKFKELDDYKNDIFKSTEPFLIDLLDSIVKKLLSESIELDKDIMVKVVKEALAPVSSGHQLTIKVNPKNVDHLEENKSKLLSEFISIKECNIVGDNDISEGGCLVEADFGVIDSRIESKFESIKDLICSIKDCDEEADLVESSDDVIDVVPKEEDASDDIFKGKDDVLSLDDDLDDDSFDFLTDDDEF